jgi:hypothetical protein
MSRRSWVIAGATLLAALPWALAAAGMVYAYYFVPQVQQKPLMLGIFLLAFWVAIACFATAVFACVDAPRRLPWLASALASFSYTLAFAALHGLQLAAG